MNQEFNLISVIKTLLKWKWHIIAITLLAGIAAIIMTVFVMKPYYSSFALIYPTNQSMGDRNVLFGDDLVNADSYYYGNKHDANRILTLANSTNLMQQIITKYNLVEHYEYEGKKYAKSNTTKKFMKNYEVYKTDKEAIRINLIDTDPDLAAQIVNNVVAIIEKETTRPIETTKKQLAELFIGKEREKKAKLDSLQNELLSLNPKSLAYELLKTTYDDAQIDYLETAKLAEQYDVAAKQSRAGIEIVEKAFPAERKFKPIRSKICIATVIIAFVLACFLALGIEQVNYIRLELEK